ncbi:MAG: tetratricopeptide repeat protein [Cyanobacteria bacterium]|nr:tetratricopeptide repeat protein [Cyanobacteria bacterium GSL.Bin21]
MSETTIGDRALRFTVLGDRAGEAQMLNLEGIDRFSQEEYEEAVNCWQQALEIAGEINDRDLEAAYNRNIGLTVQHSQGLEASQYQRAIKYHEKDLAIARELEDRGGEGGAYGNLGNAYQSLGQYQQAMKNYRQALNIAWVPASSTLLFPELGLKAGRSLGNLAFTQGDWQAALDAYEISLAATEQLRTWSLSDARRKELVEEAVPVYQNFIHACIQLKQYETALKVADQSRSKQLVDFMHSSDLYQEGEMPAEMKQLLLEYETINQQLQQRQNSDSPQGGGNRQIQALGTKSEYPIPEKQFNRVCKELSNQWHQIWKNSIEPILAELSQRLGLNELIDSHLQNVEELLIIPHLFLHQIPFNALPIQQEGKTLYLSDLFTIRLTPSCQILDFCYGRKPVSGDAMGTVENATEDLIFTEYETDQVAQRRQIPPEKRLRGKNATLANFLEELTNVSQQREEAETVGTTELINRFEQRERALNRYYEQFREIEKNSSQEYEESCPFSHPDYWSAFVCQGLGVDRANGENA